ncbi:MAG: PIG-L family deacetylase [Actinomycetota bacterium]|nr:PIG-L family deacetylase [Actinomycetota bacterium]
MLPLSLGGSRVGPMRLLAIGAHPDDIEIGCGGTLLGLAERFASLKATFVVMTGDERRTKEAAVASELFLPGCDVTLRLGGLTDGRLPSQWNDAKDLLENVAAAAEYDLVLVPSRGDAHQDHRLIAELTPTVWRDHLVLGYELPKVDGDIGRPSIYVPLSADVAREKVRRLTKAFPSQVERDWWDDELFLGLARIRGMECRSRYAEAFTMHKGTLTW